MEADYSHFGTCRRFGIYRIVLIGNGRTSLGYGVRDISHKHEGISRKPSTIGYLVRFLDQLIRPN